MTGTSDQIRNVQQSVQYRDVIKQASDVLVYIDGADYLINPYLGEQGIPVSFNDYVNSWTSTYDIDAMIPSGSLTLTVPVQEEYLFRMTGGNNILNTMAEIRVFAKGYYLSPQGNTVYRQIFKGFITSISYTRDGMMVNISMSCLGALGMLERMQIDMNPALQSSAPIASVPFSSSQWNLDPYQTMAWVFLYSSMIDGFEQYSLQQMAMENSEGGRKGNPYYEAVEERYVAKWQALLFDLARDAHVFGVPNVNNVISAIQSQLKKVDQSQSPLDKEAMGVWSDLVGKIAEPTAIQGQQGFYDQLRNYMPDMGFSAIQLLNGRVTSRLERLRYMASLVNFEAYQDIDGAIVIKPPLYNLDVVNLQNDGTTPSVPADTGADPSLDYITNTTNPFVVQQSEILSEQENEDEANVRMTRITARGSYTPALQWQASKEMLAVAEDIDIPKLTQFGMRTESPRDVNWFRDGDYAAIYAYAASEMARANRGFRYYSITIPLRPELKLGFPMFFPHKDMYGYIKSVSMSWNKGSSATTQVTLDSLRRRPMFPVDTTVPGEANQPSRKVRVMKQQPNLVLQWTQADASAAVSTSLATADASSANNQSPAQLAGKIATLPVPEQIVVKQQLQMMESRRVGGMEYTLNSDSVTHNWRIQDDRNGIFNYQRPLGSAPAGETPTAKNDYYEALRQYRPYTDQKGYELVGPFPWGRWKSLKDALTTFTIANKLYTTTSNDPKVQPVSAETTNLSDTNAFLFAADDSAVANETASQVLTNMTNQRSIINDTKVFELSYSSGPTVQTGPGATLSATPSASEGTHPTIAAGSSNAADQKAKAATMVSGKATSQSLFERILNSLRNTLTS